LESGVLGALMETHNSLDAFLHLLFYFASSLYSLKPFLYNLPSFLFFKVLVLRLADTQQQLPAASAAPGSSAAASQAACQSVNQILNQSPILLYQVSYTLVNKEVEQRFSGRAVIL
jgi:hypothetical protein